MLFEEATRADKGGGKGACPRRCLYCAFFTLLQPLPEIIVECWLQVNASINSRARPPARGPTSSGAPLPPPPPLLPPPLRCCAPAHWTPSLLLLQQGPAESPACPCFGDFYAEAVVPHSLHAEAPNCAPGQGGTPCGGRRLGVRAPGPPGAHRKAVGPCCLTPRCTLSQHKCRMRQGGPDQGQVAVLARTGGPVISGVFPKIEMLGH